MFKTYRQNDFGGFWVLAAALALPSCGPRHFSEALTDGSPTTVMDGGSGSIDGGGGGIGLGGTTGGNPIIPIRGCSNDPNAYVECLSLYFSVGVDEGGLGFCDRLHVENGGLNLITGKLDLRISGFGISCPTSLFTRKAPLPPPISPGFTLAVDSTAGASAEVKNANGTYSTASKTIYFKVGGSGRVINIGGKAVVEYTVDFRSALIRLQSVGSAARSGKTTAEQIADDIGGRTYQQFP